MAETVERKSTGDDEDDDEELDEVVHLTIYSESSRIINVSLAIQTCQRCNLVRY